MEENPSSSEEEPIELILDTEDETEFSESANPEPPLSNEFSEENETSFSEPGKKEILAEQMKTEGKKFFSLLLNLMANPQEEIRAMYAKKPISAFGIVIGLNIVLVAFYRSYASNWVTELKVGTISSFFVFVSLLGYLKQRDPKTKWHDAFSVLGIAHFPLLPCVLLSNFCALMQMPKLSEMLYTTGSGFSFLFAFLCLIEIFQFPVKRSIYTIPIIFVVSEFVARAII